MTEVTNYIKMEEKIDLPHIGRLSRFVYFEMMYQSQTILDALGFEDVKAAHSVVFQFIGEGCRMTELAQKANTTKQNMKYLLEYLEERAYVSHHPDLNDGRAQIFSLTSKGYEYYQAAAGAVQAVEKEWVKLLGKTNMQKLKNLLYELQVKIKNQNNEQTMK